MEKSLSELDNIQELINIETDKYKQAIRDNRQFEEVKVIYLKIKTLQTMATALLDKTDQLYKSDG